MTLKNHQQKTYRNRKSSYCYDLSLLERQRLELGLKKKHVVERVAKKFKAQSANAREVYYILSGKRRFPNPVYVKQIAEVLGVSMTDLVVPGESSETTDKNHREAA